MKRTSGLTLVELLVAVALASVIITSILGVFVSFIQYQVVLQDERTRLDSIRFTLSDIARELSFGYDYVCGTGAGSSCSCLAFSDQLGRRVKVRRNSTSNRVEKRVNDLDSNPDTCADTDGWVPLTIDSVSVTDFSFLVDVGDDRQPRIKIKMTVGSGADASVFQTQVTRRILEPSDDIIEVLSSGGDSPGLGSTVFFAFNDSGVCSDEQGGVYEDALCQRDVGVSAAEFITGGLFVLRDDGLVFFIPQSEINLALGASGGGSPVTVSSSSIESDVSRVIGLGSCRLCANDPRGIVSLHSVKNAMYARGSNGSLYVLRVSGSRAFGQRILTGGVSANAVKYIDTTPSRILLLFRDANGDYVLRLYSDRDGPVLTSSLLTGSCNAFSGASDLTSPSGTLSCRQLLPDTSPPSVQPASLVTALGNSLSSVDRVQVLGSGIGTLTFRYRGSGGARLFSLWNDGTEDRSGSDIAVGGGLFVQNPSVSDPEGASAGVNKFTFPCQSNGSLCKFDAIDSSSATEIALGGDSLLSHVHLASHPVGLTDNKHLAVFNAVNSDSTSSAYLEVPLYDASDRVFCGTGSEITLLHLSRESPLSGSDLVALVGDSIKTGRGSGQPTSDIYLLVPNNLGKVKTDCGISDIVERHDISGGGVGPNLDVLRLTNVKFIDQSP